MSGADASQTWVALLRGIDVGGNRKVPMAALARLVRAAGGERVQTYIQSGNVVFRHRQSDPEPLAADLQARLRAEFGFDVPVVLRTAQQLVQVQTDSPWLAAGHGPAALHVGFLSRLPEPARVLGLDPQRGAPDEFRVLGSEVHLLIRGGFATTRLTNAWLDAHLKCVCTVRNWKTVVALGDLAQQLVNWEERG